jgi:flavin reductase
MIDTGVFKRGMRRLASGVSLVTTIDSDGRPHGMAATSVTSLSTEPPSLLVCVAQSAACHNHIVAAGAFCVSILGESDARLVRLFSNPEHRHERFADTGWQILTTGAPALSRALAVFDCRVSKQIENGSHTIFIGEVAAASVRKESDMPLIYFEAGLIEARLPA